MTYPGTASRCQMAFSLAKWESFPVLPNALLQSLLFSCSVASSSPSSIGSRISAMRSVRQGCAPRQQKRCVLVFLAQARPASQERGVRPGCWVEATGGPLTLLPPTNIEEELKHRSAVLTQTGPQNEHTLDIRNLKLYYVSHLQSRDSPFQKVGHLYLMTCQTPYLAIMD